MSSRLFKHQMASTARPPVQPHLLNSMADIYGFNNKTDTFTKQGRIPAVEPSSTMSYNGIHVSPDGRYVVTTTSTTGVVDANAVYKRTAGGYVRLSLPNSSGEFNSVCWSKDSKNLLIGNGSTLRWYRLNADGQFVQVTTLGFAYRVMSIALSESGKFLAVSQQLTVFLYMYPIDLVTGKFGASMSVGTQPGNYAAKIKFVGSDLLYFGTSSSGGNFIYSINETTGAVTRSVPTGASSTYAYSMAVSADNKYVAVGRLQGLDYYAYDSATRSYRKIYENLFGARTLDVAFSKDGNYLALALNAAPHVLVYRRVGDTLVQLTIPAATVPPTGGMNGVGFAEPDGY